MSRHNGNYSHIGKQRHQRQSRHRQWPGRENHHRARPTWRCPPKSTGAPPSGPRFDINFATSCRSAPRLRLIGGQITPVLVHAAKLKLFRQASSPSPANHAGLHPSGKPIHPPHRRFLRSQNHPFPSSGRDGILVRRSLERSSTNHYPQRQRPGRWNSLRQFRCGGCSRETFFLCHQL